MQEFILVFHLLIAVGIIGLVLVQQGKGADVGAAFGAGASQTLFGARGATSFLMKLTGGLALAFFITSLLLGHFSATHQATSALDAIPDLKIERQQPPANEQGVAKGDKQSSVNSSKPAAKVDQPLPKKQPAQ